jgi:hypothetical protein
MMQNFAKTDLPETRSNPNIGHPNPRAELMVDSPESAGKARREYPLRLAASADYFTEPLAVIVRDRYNTVN